MTERCQVCKATSKQGIQFIELCPTHARAAEYRAALEETTAKAEWLAECLLAARDLLAACQKRMGWLPEQGGYSTRMDELEMTVGKGIADIEKVLTSCHVAIAEEALAKEG
jgi:hypothetical protein